MDNSVFEDIRKALPDYIIRFPSENPKNPLSRATEEELNIIERLNNQPGVKEWNSQIRIGGKNIWQSILPSRWSRHACFVTAIQQMPRRSCAPIWSGCWLS